jgi:drug/metabolite transporter (DMT)-like permease
MKSRLGNALVWLFGIAVFVTIAIVLEDQMGIPFALTFRIACASACIVPMYKTLGEYPGEKWPLIALLVAFLFNFTMFFSPLAKLPASKGDILFFALPDVAIFMAARAWTYPVTDVHQRAVRQQLIVGLILAIAVCALFMSLLLLPPHTTHR